VHPEVFDDTVDCAQDAHVAPLNVPLVRQIRGVEGGQDGVRFFDCRVEPSAEVSRRDRAALVELLLTAPRVGGAAEAADDPLADIPRQMENEISDAVARLIGAPPELLPREAVEAGFDLREILVPQIAAVPARPWLSPALVAAI